jgi:hypothetical protein
MIQILALADKKQLRQRCKAYWDGFSPIVQVVLTNFEFRSE